MQKKFPNLLRFHWICLKVAFCVSKFLHSAAKCAFEHRVKDGPKVVEKYMSLRSTLAALVAVGSLAAATARVDAGFIASGSVLDSGGSGLRLEYAVYSPSSGSDAFTQLGLATVPQGGNVETGFAHNPFPTDTVFFYQLTNTSGATQPIGLNFQTLVPGVYDDFGLITTGSPTGTALTSGFSNASSSAYTSYNATQAGGQVSAIFNNGGKTLAAGQSSQVYWLSSHAALTSLRTITTGAGASFANIAVAGTPEPGSLALLGSLLIPGGVIGYRRRAARKQLSA